jgi:hypothetical protein
MRRIVTVVAVVTASLRGMTTPRIKMVIPFTGHYEREYTLEFKRPA